MNRLAPEIVHTPVLLDEVLAALRPRPGGWYVDCTLGGGGHAAAILEASTPGGKLLGIDADPEAVRIAQDRLHPFGEAAIIVNDNFEHLEEICAQHNFKPVDGILFDLGVSSFQLAESGRGFSIRHDGPLDMRFSPQHTLTAADVVNDFSEPRLAEILWKYGEEPKSRRIARAIVQSRPLATTGQLAKVIEKAVFGARGRIHPATRAFQAIRIVVNRELECLERALKQAIGLLRREGRLAVISFHSLEDRLVKQFMALESAGCLCPPEVVRCVCGHTPSLGLVTRKVIKPSAAEVAANPRSRSARMRVAERL
ncbi:MAG: 16S rRNA (cytosine(1402)-N(4))-methyltransferase RsmH [Chloroflexi bacterium]|nr:16S rRNA (cytosine(1402)-N(4))-methyltransferase RsmH [Chloroflexota bacterium]